MAKSVGKEQVGRGRLPVQARDRRPALAALALLLIVGGGLGAGLLVYRSGQQTDVLVAAHEIKPGQRMSSGDFSTARVSGDAGAIVEASHKRSIVGSYATVGIPSGTLVNRLMFKVGNIAPSNGVVVGVSLTSAQRPAVALAAGDVVRAYYVTKGTSSDTTPQIGRTLAQAVRVVSVHSAGGSGQDTVTASLLVDETTANTLISAASTNSVALAQLPVGTTPAIDFKGKR